MNPQFNYTNLTQQISVPELVQPKPTLIRFNPLTGQLVTTSLVAEAQTAQQGFGGIVAELQNQFDQNLPNYVVGAIGLAMIFIGIGALASPAALTAAKAAL